MIKFIWNWICSLFSTKTEDDTMINENQIGSLNVIEDEPIKVGLLIGCNYRGTKAELRGCINDTTTIHNELFPKRCYDYILTLTDDSPILPTKNNILFQLQKMLNILEDGDTFFLHCSGHGTQQEDVNNDEKDGKDEIFITLDMKAITDDTFQNIFKSIQKKINIFILMDCCHSGTIIDLPYSLQDSNGNIIKNNSEQFNANIVMISGCQDQQVSYDSFINQKHQGALTFAFKVALQNFHHEEPLPLRQLLDIIHNILKQRNYPQLPQLSFSNPKCEYFEI
jgi:hypothetical protein